MNILNHRLQGVDFRPLKAGAAVPAPRYIVLHNTAGGSMQGSYDYLKKMGNSYHVLVNRDGTPWQCVPTNVAAGHSGKSNWRGRNNVNGFTLGISAANWGDAEQGLPADRVVKAVHRNGGPEKKWEKYPEAQIATMLEVCRAMLAAYPSIIDMTGHDEVAVGRKVDPGPAFPWERFHALVPNRVTDTGPRYRVHAPGDTLNLRAAAHGKATVLAELPHGRPLFLRSKAYKYVDAKTAIESGWASVNLDGDLKHDGFVAFDNLRPD